MIFDQLTYNTGYKPANVSILALKIVFVSIAHVSCTDFLKLYDIERKSKYDPIM